MPKSVCNLWRVDPLLGLLGSCYSTGSPWLVGGRDLAPSGAHFATRVDKLLAMHHPRMWMHSRLPMQQAQRFSAAAPKPLKCFVELISDTM